MKKIEINGRLYYSITFMIFLMMVMGLASASTIGTVIQGSCITLSQTCSNCTFVNITNIFYPNKTMQTLNKVMTKQGTDYNYTFCSTQSIGEYFYNTLGDPSGVLTLQPVSFIVSPTGLEQTTAQGIGSAIFIIIMLSVTIIFAYIGFRLSESKFLWIVGVFFLFLSVIMVVYNVWLGVEYSRNWVGTDNSAMPIIIFYSFLALVVLGLLASCILAFRYWKDLVRYVKKELKSKEDDDDEFDELEKS